MTIAVTIDQKGDLRSYVEASRSLMTSAEAANVVGLSGVQAWKANFAKREQQGNRLGGKRTHYWAKAAGSVNMRRESGGQVILSASQIGLKQRYFGGTITAKNARMLTIPVNAAAHGKRAREISGLKLIKSGKGAGAKLLLAKTETGSNYLEVFYVLKKSVTQQPDPTVVNEAEILDAGMRGLKELVSARQAIAKGAYN